MMLVLPMNRACACQGTSCPSPGNPECDDMTNPALQPFDPGGRAPELDDGCHPRQSAVAPSPAPLAAAERARRRRPRRAQSRSATA